MKSEGSSTLRQECEDNDYVHDKRRARFWVLRDESSWRVRVKEQGAC